MATNRKTAAALWLAAATAAAPVSARTSWESDQALAIQQIAKTSLEQRRARGVVAGWPRESAAAAARVIDKYGTPDQIETAEVSWFDRAPFARIDVYRDAPDPSRPYALRQLVAYVVHADKWSELKVFDRGVAYDPGLQALVACSDREDINLLALNLADEIVRGEKTSLEARALFDRTLALAYAGKSSRLTSKLLFRPQPRTPGP
jgi:hypothetical protein